MSASKKNNPINQNSSNEKQFPVGIEVVSVGQKRKRPPKIAKKDRKKLTKEEKKNLKFKKKKNKKPFNFKIACQNFFVKFMRDIIRIKWIPSSILGIRFLSVLLFILGFAVIYVAVDAILKLIF